MFTQLKFGKLILFFVCLFVASGPILVSSATYYVDYVGGNDSNAGTSASRAWQHAPGDTNGPARTLAGGDKVIFKGGVNYRGTVKVTKSGAVGNPIIYDGNSAGTWGTGKAIIDGSEVLISAWTQCTSATDCGDNPNWKNIYYSALPSGLLSYFTPLFQDDEFTYLAQAPNPKDYFDFDVVADFTTVPLNDPNIHLTNTSLTDPRVFTQSNPNYWVGTIVGIWRLPNVVVYAHITSFNPATHTVYFADIGGNLYTDRDEKYMLLNHVSLIDTQGEMVYNDATNRMYLWPYSNPAGSEFTLGRRTMGIYTQGYSNLVIDGFKVWKQYADTKWWNSGAGITSGSTGQSSSNVVIRNNEVSHIRSLVGQEGIDAGGTNILVENNYVHDCQRCIGISGGGTNSIVRNNVVTRASRLGIWFMGAVNSQIVGNTISDIHGSHSNPWSVYSNSNNVLVAGNRIYDSNNGGTFENSSNLIIYNNFINAGNSGVSSWGGSSGVTILNNTFMQGISLSDDNNVVFKNNITKAGGGGDRTHNIYTGFSWNQEARFGWVLGTGEIAGGNGAEPYKVVDSSLIFANAPRFEATISSFNDNSSLQVLPQYSLAVAPGDYLVIDDNTANARQITAISSVRLGGNSYTRITFTPSISSQTGTKVAVWRTNNNFVPVYNLKSNSVAVDAGTNVTALLPVTSFSDYDFTKDLAGNPRVSGAWDIGAYEYNSGNPPLVNEVPIVPISAPVNTPDPAVVPVVPVSAPVNTPVVPGSAPVNTPAPAVVTPTVTVGGGGGGGGGPSLSPRLDIASTNTEVISHIKALILKLQQSIATILSARLSGIQPASSSTPHVDTSAPIVPVSTPYDTSPLSHILYYGITDPQVRTLQNFLNTHGFPVATYGPGSLGLESTYFGLATKQAVMRFQAANGIPSLGGVGAMTREKINDLMR